jgi:hypothetical protein
MTPASKPFRALVDEWLAAYDDLYAVLDALTPDQREQPDVWGGWNPRQMVAHLAGWHYEAIRRFSAITAGDPFDPNYNIDQFNTVQVEARAHLDWVLTLDDLREVIDILREQAYDVPEYKAEREPRYAGWLTDLMHHAREHRARIQAACPPN